MIRWLYLLRILVVLNLILTGYFILFNMNHWRIYYYINASIILGYLWFNYIRIFYHAFSKEDYGESSEAYTVIVPCYNEEPDLLKQAVKSLLNSDDNEKEIFIVDDGSKNNIWKTIQEIKEWDGRITTIRFPENKGKRFAHELAIKQSKYDYIISIDSDTVIAKKAIRKLLAPFKDKSVGATTGNCLIKNEHKNILTKIQAGLYWVGLNIYKRGQSTQGNVVCCSGCLSAYRKSDLLDILPEYVTQTFLGNKCGASEDRYLTNLMNEKGLKILYIPESKCYTEAPFELKKFLKQQMRWKRGFYRECLYTQTYAWKKSKVLAIENTLWLMLSPIIALPTVIMAYYLVITNPMSFIINILPFTILFGLCRDSLFFLEEPRKALNYLPFIPLYLFVLYPLNIWAIFSSNPEKWGTR